MKRSDFYYELPEELIARYPAERRSASRLLLLNKHTGALADSLFEQLPEQLNAGDLLVFNNTKVLPARLLGAKATGGKIEMLVERVLSDTECLAHVRASKAPKPGSRLLINDGEVIFEMLERQGELFHLRLLTQGSLLETLERVGHMPLPPYIDRPDETFDQERYQTVYAQHPGAVAAPTAGLHFDQALLTRLEEAGVESAYVTLHVGAGTFQPVRVDSIAEHKMHSEWLEVSPEAVEKIEATKKAGGRIIAVGTTSVRSLETAAQDGVLTPYQGETDIFIYPGYQFNVVDGLVTNFHLPESTLIMLVSALAGREAILQAYQHAVENRYRFFSYGDAMFIA